MSTRTKSMVDGKNMGKRLDWTPLRAAEESSNLVCPLTSGDFVKKGTKWVSDGSFDC
jgi:hypothetical protein